jgi:translation initiation factor IF-2
MNVVYLFNMAKKRIYEVAKEIGVSTHEMFKLLEEVGIKKSSPFHTIDEEEYEIIKELFADKVKKEKVAVEEKPRGVPRPPIVAVLGHVDHGKTTLLDTIRKTDVARHEAGGITQSIGAYQVEHNGKKITFIDTPGHEAFTTMRARGAQATDIAVLVVAADDGVMAQTKEAISHARAAKVPIIVAINKIDKTNADPNRVKEQLSKEGLVPDDWGGDTVTVQISALKGENIDDLLDMIILLAEMEGIRANPNDKAKGIIIESYLDLNKGPLASAVIKDGTLHEREIIVAGTAYGRIRALLDERGKRLKEATPGMPVQILGLSDVPPAGVPLEVFANLNEAKSITFKRKEEERLKSLRPRRTIADLFAQLEKKGELKLILKADTIGSLEALQGELFKLKERIEDVTLEILHAAIGNITESDVLLASSVEEGAVIIGFRVDIDRKAEEIVKEKAAAVKIYDVIYKLTEDVESAMKGMVEPQYEEVVIGEAEIRAVFKTSVGKVAGCYVREGVVTRDAKARVIREGEVIFEGSIRSLRRFERDVRQVEKQKECGIKIEGFEDVRAGDRLEFFVKRIKR